ncbi:DUF5009 domain-containing protein [Paucibacter sp. APW11]|uniref:DUF5009 domain-containing protein n=1 Tax=Roseateles aquae TaxID=3077235 RepID=A0ABU3PIJ3_9BURK|nr:DUF5009 domain-containing protein [Paucibacter sp. APW11]MDT9002378.1 DUF5009 domain-containing protein [Paucibacter sp. APW11]
MSDSPRGRSAAIDAFRALTVLAMITVNEWHGIAGLPAWMKHYPADADAMSFVDMVFPAFLFIVGMSIPLALAARQAQGVLRSLAHIGWRTAGLLIVGLFMVNAEGGFLASAMPLPIAAWALLSYLATFLVWGSLRGGPPLAWPWRLAGGLLFLALAWCYRGGADGSLGLQPQWWGILGLIGWAYLIGCLVHLLAAGRLWPQLLAMGLLLAYYAVARRQPEGQAGVLALLLGQSGHAVHALLVIAGMLCQRLVLGAAQPRRGLQQALLFALLLALVGLALRPAYGISKIYATPSWALFSAAACVLLFVALQRWMGAGEAGGARALQRGLQRGLQPFAAHPLLAYMIPFVVFQTLALVGLQLPAALRQPWPGLLWGPVYALLVLALVRRLAARGWRLRL